MATGVFTTALTSIGVASVSGANDWFTVHDTSATALKKIQAADVLKRLLSSTDISWMSALANIAAVDMANDKFFVWDADASQIKTLTATQIGDRLLTTLDISALSALSGLGAVSASNDSFLVWDYDANVFKTLNAAELVTRFWRGYRNDVTTTPQSLTSATTGQIYTNTGAAIAITFQLPAASSGLRYSFIRVADYGITLDGNASETINGALTYTMAAAGRVDIECFTTGTWVITSDSTRFTTSTEAFTSNDTLTAAETGKLCTNVGASATVTLTAPPATVGLEYTLVRQAAYALRFNPDGTETVRGGGAGDYVELLGYGALTFQCMTAGVWDILHDSALWAFEP